MDLKLQRQSALRMFLLLFGILQCVSALCSDTHFMHYSGEQGLSHPKVKCVIEDDQGFLWFGTEAGLNRFDGYSFKVFRNDPLDPYSLSNDNIQHILKTESREGPILWIATRFGLNKLNLETEKFTHYESKIDKPGSSGSIIYKLTSDTLGNIWMGTSTGLRMFNPATSEFKNVIPDLTVINVFADKNGYIWVGTVHAQSTGLLKYDPIEDLFTEIEHSQGWQPTTDNRLNCLYISPKESPDFLWYQIQGQGLAHYNAIDKTHTVYEPSDEIEGSINTRRINSITEDDGGFLWLGTGRGVSRFDRKTKKYRNYVMDPDTENSLSAYYANAVFVDDADVLWVCTHNGINKLNLQAQPFENYQKKANASNSLNSNRITSVHIDSSGVLWIGTDWGLNVLDRKKKRISKFPKHLEQPQDIIIRDISDGPDGFLFFGTNGGLFRLDSSAEINSQIKRYRNEDHHFEEYEVISKVPIGNNIHHIHTDIDGQIWLATMGGVNCFDSKTELFEAFYAGDMTRTLCAPRKQLPNAVLIGTYSHGLFHLDRTTHEPVAKYRNDPFDPSSLSNNLINDIIEDSKGRIWVATHKGLNLLYPHKQPDSVSFRHFTTADGLPNNIVYSIQEDDQGYLWLGTNHGLSRFDPTEEVFKNYYKSDGLAGNEFIAKSSSKGFDGELLFGTNSGLTTFFPDQLQDNKHLPPVEITDFKLFHKSVGIDPSVTRISESEPKLPKHISRLQSIELSNQLNVFSFEFAALDYHNPMKNQYAYKMEGFSDEWTYTDALNRIATYTNLDPGEYTFRVKASNNDGYWNEKGVSLAVIIHPPWWATQLAYIGYILLFVGVVIAIWRFQLSKLKLTYQVEMEHLSAEHYHQLDEHKSRFMENISHEFRTPLTLILGPVSNLLTQVKDREMKADLNLIKRQAKRLLELVVQLLDISKLEDNKMILQASQQNIVPLLRGLFLSFASLAERNETDLDFSTSDENIQVYFERDAMVKILNNLLSNAFKFTQHGDQVKLDVTTSATSSLGNEGEVIIRVSDTGIGIPETQLSKIFDRFHQADNTETRQWGGTGIGLSLTKELVELHHGTISVDSNPEVGTVFIVRLPLGQAHLAPGEVVEPTHLTDPAEDEVGPTNITEKVERSSSDHHEGDLPVVLIVEDNLDVRNYIRSYLEKDYECHEAMDGQEGLEKVRKIIPDLVISDIMMPKMNGLDFCRHLKTDERTSHIPVLMLTAKADIDSKVKGLETGADAYLTKPFEAMELKIRIKNLIDQRQALREKFQREFSLIPKDMDISSMDRQFLERALRIITDNLNESAFKVDGFAQKMFMSRQQLNRKLKGLTGRTAVEFIRWVRLKRAAILLQNNHASITEIAYQVGFSSPSHFSRSFHQEFGKTPTEFLDAQKNGATA